MWRTQDRFLKKPLPILRNWETLGLIFRHLQPSLFWPEQHGNPSMQYASAAQSQRSTIIVTSLTNLQKLHGIQHMLWMGGEPLLRPDVLQEGITLFSGNTVTTKGTLKPIDLPNCTYVISVDGPPKLNNAIRGNGTFKKVINTLSNIPEKFSSTVMCQCVVTRQNEDS